MGMDVHGKGNKQAYFRASICSWPGVLYVIDLANKLHALDLDTSTWNYNDGAGLNSAEDCERLASAMEKTLPVLVGNHEPEPLCIAVGVAAAFGIPMAPMKVDHEDIAEFITFLRECRGFAIH